MNQVHGNNVIPVDKTHIGMTIPACDGLITNDESITLCVNTADCLPISIIDSNHRAIGLVHAGWRGLHNEIIKVAIKEMIHHYGSEPEKLKIKIGPHICQRHYEIQDDVAVLFTSVITFNSKKMLNLTGIASNQFVDMGVRIENISVDRRCTFEDRELPSYRRGDRGKRLTTTLNIKSS